MNIQYVSVTSGLAVSVTAGRFRRPELTPNLRGFQFRESGNGLILRSTPSTLDMNRCAGWRQDGFVNRLLGRCADLPSVFHRQFSHSIRTLSHTVTQSELFTSLHNYTHASHAQSPQSMNDSVSNGYNGTITPRQTCNVNPSYFKETARADSRQ